MREAREEGLGLIDLMIALLLLSILATAAGLVVGAASKATLSVQGGMQAEVLAKAALDQAEAEGCGTATGFEAPAAAEAIWDRCGWGTPAVHSESVVQGASYEEGPFAETLDLGFRWAWDQGAQAPSCEEAGSLQGQPVAAPPDEILVSASVSWADQEAGGSHVRTLEALRAAPPPVVAAWQAGGLGAIAVVVEGAAAPVVVGLAVPGWQAGSGAGAQPVWVEVDTGPPSEGVACAWLPYVPASAQGYEVWAGSPSNEVATPPVAAGAWSVAEVAA